MCRFLMVSSQNEIKPDELLNEFATKCEESIAPNNDLQEDGWGIAWLDSNHQWQSKKSLLPIWKEKNTFDAIPKSSAFVVHARSATFPKEKGNISFNQPYTYGKYCFVFNGSLSGVKLTKPVKGEIGAQKIWTLLQEKLENLTSTEAIEWLHNFLEKHSSEITALNIGVATSKSLTALCKYKNNSDYYGLKYSSDDINIICSEKLNNFSMKYVQNSHIINLHA